MCVCVCAQINNNGKRRPGTQHDPVSGHGVPDTAFDRHRSFLAGIPGGRLDHQGHGGDKSVERQEQHKRTIRPFFVLERAGPTDQTENKLVACPVRRLEGRDSIRNGSDLFRNGKTGHHFASRFAQYRRAADVHVQADRQTNSTRSVHEIRFSDH